MKNKLYILLLFTISSLYSQNVEFKGQFKQGSLVFGTADNLISITLDNKDIPFDESGKFVLGFDRDDKEEHLLIVKTKEKTILKKFVPEKTEYKIQRINGMKQKYVSPPKKELDRIAAEREITKTAKSMIGGIKNAEFNDGFIKPISKGRISSVFGSQRILNGTPKNFHNGLDIAVPEGTSVKAMTDGKVLLNADNFYYAGNFIIIDHGLGVNSMYLHLSKSFVTEGQIVKKGEVIGEVGTTGRSTGPHLHWTVQWFDKRVDPNTVFNYKVD